MLLWHALVLGVVEGITEFLPISSTGHLLIVSQWLGLDDAFTQTFDIAIQAGAMVAVLLVTWREWLKPSIWTRVLAGFVPTAVVGFLLYHFVKTFLLAHPISIPVALVLGGVLIIAFEYWLKRARPSVQNPTPALESITHAQAFTVGLAQSLAVIPGVSRSAATIVGGLALGLSRATVVSYSFLLAVPTIASAAVYDLYKQRGLLSADHLGLLAVGFVVSGIVAFIVIRWLLAYIRRHDFTYFGIYRIVFGLFVGWWMLK